MTEITKTIDELIEAKAPSRIPDDGNNDIKRELTFGESLVGLTFNPSGDADVTHVKQLCAELANIVQGAGSPNSSYLFNLIKGNALREILNAQMNAVKLLTLKY